jgi:hypothetical protein
MATIDPERDAPQKVDLKAEGNRASVSRGREQRRCLPLRLGAGRMMMRRAVSPSLSTGCGRHGCVIV